MAYQRTAALVAAVKLGIFTAIGSGHLTADELAHRTGASARGLRMLCDFLTVIGLLEKNELDYSLPEQARIFLDEASPFAMGSIVDFVASPEMLDLFLREPASYVRHGGSDGLGSVAPDHPVWVRFARAMAPFAATTARRVACWVATLPDAPGTVLDIAAGHGLFGIEVAKALPDAFVTALDWSGVLDVACTNAEAAGVADRFRPLPGNALDLNWTGTFDLILLPNFLHHFDSETCVKLLRKVRASLAPGGTAIAIEFMPNEDRISPMLPAMFAFWMLATTPAGDAWTARELNEMAVTAGFAGVTTRPLHPTPQSLIVFEDYDYRDRSSI
jgi:2-polyprenyl-3-methyl-5-hydroxy-6-metoxy-1,4-benzoquinol methylase